MKPKKAIAASPEYLTVDRRRAFIRKAQVWRPTNIAQMDLRAGPTGSGAFEPNGMVVCDYVPAKLSGSPRKFDCGLPDGGTLK